MTMLFLLFAQDSQTQAESVFRAFGYPDAKPELIRRTESGGAEFASGSMTLLMDKNGVPWTFKIKSVRFESSPAARSIPRIKSLLKRFPIDLPPGKWCTARSLAPHAYGRAKSSSRYFFVPWLDGYPFLKGSQMTVQLSSDSERVLEWMVHRWPVAQVKAPKHIISPEGARKRFQELGDESARRYKTAYAKIGQVELGWLGPERPVLAYICPVTVFIRHSGGTKGSGGWAEISAETGKLFERPTR